MITMNEISIDKFGIEYNIMESYLNEPTFVSFLFSKGDFTKTQIKYFLNLKKYFNCGTL